MIGVITFQHVITHPILIVKEYGAKVFLRCIKNEITFIRTGKQFTFLSTL